MANYPTPACASVMTLTPYVGGASSVKGVERIIKLSSNECAFGTSPTAVQACKDFAEKMFRYPDGGATALREAIGQVYGLNPDRIVCGTGSDELIGLLCHAYLDQGDEVVITQYGFLMYRIYALGSGAIPVTAPEKEYHVDVDEVLKAVTPKTKMVFIANPGNPTGTYLPKSEVERLCRELPSNVVLVLDAAYAEFLKAEDYEAGVAFVDMFPNVVMLRTFSKIYGLGGIRLGWSYSSQEIADVLNRIRGPFNVNAFAQAIGTAVVKDRDFVEKCYQHNIKWQEKMREALAALGLSQTPSVGNFILVEFPKIPGKTAEEADMFLQSKGIIVRRVASYGLPDALRMTIGNDEEMEALLEALTEFMTR